jgi:tRNA (adenine22-N1)-methyltransferase
MKQLILSNRLQAIAAFIGTGAAGVIDVGTDHGYLPVWLAQSGSARRIVATDIRKGPLSRAVLSAEEYGVSDKIEFVLTDGLNGIDCKGFDTVVIAGMGGETVIHILENAAWTRAPGVRLILQPQTKTDELAAWLSRNGYALKKAALAADEGRYYLIYSAGRGSGECGDPPELLLRDSDPLLPGYLAGLVRKTRRALDGMERSASPPDGALHALRGRLDKLIRMKEETDTWQR